MDIEVKIVINIFTIIDGKINLLVNSNDDLIIINCLDDLDLTYKKYINDNIFIKNLDLKQCYAFSEKKDNLEITVLYVGIINSNDIKLNNRFKYIELDKLDKNNIYINKSVEYLKNYLTLYSSIKKIYPKEFILPEIQSIYENLLNKKYDRRNFRKRLIKLNVIECLDKVSLNKNGRPAKIYRFKEVKDDIVLF